MGSASRRSCLAWGSAGLLSLAGPLRAQPTQVPRLPNAVMPVLPAARLRGRGLMRFFGLTLCEVSLWAGADFDPQRYASFAFALELQYARHFEGAAIAKRSIDEMVRAVQLAAAKAQAWQALLIQAFPDVVPGDRLTGLRVPGQSTVFFHNDKPTLPIADPEFAAPFFGIWLAPTTSDLALRQQLTGLGP
jgi:hypothetical protein